jgi:hypothetical protein
MNREMLKEAIAEAKTIKETAIANAKAALEEAFTPQLTAMFAEQLNEEEEEDGVKENYDGVDEGDLSLEEILAELEATNEGDSQMEEEGVYETMDENLMLEDMSDEEIEELVVQVIDDMIASGKLVAGEESEEEEGEEEEMEMDMDDMDMDMGGEEEGEEEIEDDEEIKIDELLAEILGEEVEEGLGDIAGKIGNVFSGKFTKAEKAFFDQSDVVQLMGALEQAKKANETSEVNKTKEELFDKVRSFATKAKDFGIEGMNDIGVLTKSLRYAIEKYDVDPKLKGIQKIATGASAGRSNPGTRTNEVELEEAYSTIEALRSELNEVNLLNAKLLYTNKIFKAKNLTESEKIKVLNTFDKAETVKEVKLVFETLTESLKTSTVKKNTIKESLGSASKTIAPAAPKQPIIEVNDAFARMQKLAGLRK